MFKTVIAAAAVAVGMFVAGCAGTPATHTSASSSVAPSIPAASADSVDDAINTHSGTPGMVQYLNALRNLFDGTGNPNLTFTVDTVGEAVAAGNFYCTPVMPDGTASLQDRKTFVHDMISGMVPDLASQYLAALDQLCTNY